MEEASRSISAAVKSLYYLSTLVIETYTSIIGPSFYLSRHMNRFYTAIAVVNMQDVQKPSTLSNSDSMVFPTKRFLGYSRIAIHVSKVRHQSHKLHWSLSNATTHWSGS